MFATSLIANTRPYLVAIAIGTVVSAVLMVTRKKFTDSSDMEKATSAPA